VTTENIFYPADMERLLNLFAKAPTVVQQETLVFLEGAMSHLRGEVVERTPTSFGLLRQSVIDAVHVTPSGMLGVVGSPLDYATPVELGSKPHGVGKAGIEALTDWASQKFGAGPVEAANIAHAVAWKIRRHGTKPVFMFKRALEENRAELAAQFAAMVRRIGAQVGGRNDA